MVLASPLRQIPVIRDSVAIHSAHDVPHSAAVQRCPLVALVSGYFISSLTPHRRSVGFGYIDIPVASPPKESNGEGTDDYCCCCFHRVFSEFDRTPNNALQRTAVLSVPSS